MTVGFEFEVGLQSYSNAGSTLSDGSACDSFPSSQCDNIFIFCHRPFRSPQDNDTSNCPLGVFQTGVFTNQDVIDFERIRDLGNGVANPLRYSCIGEWPVSLINCL